MLTSFLSPIGPGHDHGNRERRLIGNTYFQNPDAWTRQFYLQQQNNAMQQQNKMLAQANWVEQLRNLYGPQFTLVQAHDATNAAAGSRVQRISVWDRARFLTGTEPPVGPLRGFPLTPGAAEQQRNGGPSLTPRTRAQILSQQQGYRPYGQRQERGPNQNPNIPQTINTNIDVSHLSPYGPEMIVPIEQQQPSRPAQRPAPRVRTGIGAWPMVAGTYFSQPRQSPQPAGQPSATLEARRKMNVQGNAKYEAQRKAKIQQEAVPEQTTRKFEAERKARSEDINFNEDLARLQKERADLTQSREKLLKERIAALQRIEAMNKEYENAVVRRAAAQKQFNALQEEAQKAAKSASTPDARAKVAASIRALMDTTRAGLTVAEADINRLSAQQANLEREMKSIGNALDLLERNLKRTTERVELLRKRLRT